MTTKNYFIYQSLLNASFGIGLLLMPQMMIDTYAVNKTAVTDAFDFVARSYGTALMGLGVAAYLMRNAQPSLARYAFLLATCVTGVLVTIIHLRAIFQGVQNNMAWLTVLLLVVVTAWSGLLVSKEDKAVLQ